MFKVTITQTKPDLTVRMFGKSSSANGALQAEHNSRLQQAQGFVSSEASKSEDNLTLTRVILWETEQHAEAFAVQFKILLNELKIKRDTYNLAVGITRKVVKETI